MKAEFTGNDKPAVSGSAVIDEVTKENIRRYAEQGRDAIDKRIEELDHKWDIEKTVQLNAALLVVAGTLLYTLTNKSSNKKWFMLSGLATIFLAQNAVTGWCPSSNIMRFFKMRTRQEIEREKYALKALRGDFNNIKTDIEKVWEAVNKIERNNPIGFMRDSKQSD